MSRTPTERERQIVAQLDSCEESIREGWFGDFFFQELAELVVKAIAEGDEWALRTTWVRLDPLSGTAQAKFESEQSKRGELWMLRSIAYAGMEAAPPVLAASMLAEDPDLLEILRAFEDGQPHQLTDIQRRVSVSSSMVDAVLHMPPLCQLVTVKYSLAAGAPETWQIGDRGRQALQMASDTGRDVG